jgi:transcriptional repressor NrdR
MRCPNCEGLDDKVIDTRESKTGDLIRRRRECLACGHRFSTRESVVRTELSVVKRDERREDFDPDKLYRGMQHACWKRPVSEAQIDALVTDITAKISKSMEREIPSHVLGEMVMQALRGLDEVAYVRFASVYRRFKDIDEFIDAVQNLSDANQKRDKDDGGAKHTAPGALTPPGREARPGT